MITSFTALNAYASCPYHYYLRYVAKLKAIETDYTGTFPGSCVHKAAELFFEWKNKMGQVDFSLFETSIPQIMENLWDSNTMHYGPDVFAENKYEATRKIIEWSKNLAHMISVHGCVQPITMSEFRWDKSKPAYISDKLQLIGGPDLCYSKRSDMPHTLIDFKNSDNELHCSDHQLFLYVLGTENTFNVKIHMAAFFLVKSMRASWRVVTEEKKKATLDWAHRIIEGIESCKFQHTSSSAACRLCPFRMSGCEHSSFKQDSGKGLSKIKSLNEIRKDLSSSKPAPLQEIPEL